MIGKPFLPPDMVRRVPLLLWLAACGDAGSPGVPPRADEAEAIVSAQPTLLLGDWSGDAGTDFQEIVGAFQDREAGLLVVGNGGDGTIRFFDLDGEWQGNRGGVGEGPDEFERLGAVFEYPGDSVLAFDRWTYRASVWPYEGRGVRWVSPADLPGELRFPRVQGALADRRLLWTAEAFDDSYDETGESHFESVAVFLTSPEGRDFQEIGKIGGAAVYRYQVSRFARGLAPFSPRPFAVATDSLVHFGSTLLPRAIEFNPSAMRFDTIRLGSARQPVSPAQVEADLAIRRREVEREYRRPTPLREARFAELELLPWPDSLPAMGAVVAGRDGRLWVADYRTPQDGVSQSFPGSRRWTAHSTVAGRRQSHDFPAPLRLLWADDAVAVGVSQDSLGVERIVVASISENENAGNR